MKIKPLNKSSKKNKLKRAHAYHYWLAAEKPKKAGRLPQLNKKRRQKATNVLANQGFSDNE